MMKFNPVIIFELLVLSLFISCKEEEASFTSFAGDWIYTFPDGKVSVTFKIGGSEIHSYYVSGANVIYGTLTKISGGLDDKSAPCNINRRGDVILSIDFKLLPTQGNGAYSIVFYDPVPNGNFTELLITKATYAISPNGVQFEMKEIIVPSSIKRK